MARVTKQGLVEGLAKKMDSKAAAEDALNAVIDEIKGNLSKGNDVALTGFGTFKVKKRKARKGRNPQTGETIQIPARKVARFKAGKSLKEAVK